MPWEETEFGLNAPGPISDLMTGLQGVSSTLESTVSVIKGFVQAAKALYTPPSDILGSIIGGSLADVENLINDMFSSGFYYLVVDPFTVHDRKFDLSGIPMLSAQAAIYTAVDSFNDVGDFNRPRFSDSAYVTAYGLLFGYPDVTSLFSAIKGFNDVLRLADVEAFLDNVAEKMDSVAVASASEREIISHAEVSMSGNTFEVAQNWKNEQAIRLSKYESTSTYPAPLTDEDIYFITNASGKTIQLAATQDDAKAGTAISFTSFTENEDNKFLISPSSLVSKVPDWESYSLKSIDVMNDLRLSMLGMVSYLKGFVSVADDTMGDMVNLIAKKAGKLVATLQNIQDIIDSFTSQPSNLIAFNLPTTQGGVKKLKQELVNVNTQLIDGKDYSFLILFVAGGASANDPTILALDNFRQFVG